MFGENFRRKYALTYQGVQNVKKGTFWTVVVNIVVMGGISILYLLMNHLVSLLIKNQAEMNVLVSMSIIYNSSSTVYFNIWIGLWRSQSNENFIGRKIASITARIFS